MFLVSFKSCVVGLLSLDACLVIIGVASGGGYRRPLILNGTVPEICAKPLKNWGVVGRSKSEEYVYNSCSSENFLPKIVGVTPALFRNPGYAH